MLLYIYYIYYSNIIVFHLNTPYITEYKLRIIWLPIQTSWLLFVWRHQPLCIWWTFSILFGADNKASNTMINSNGLRTEPWCTPTVALKALLSLPFLILFVADDCVWSVQIHVGRRAVRQQNIRYSHDGRLDDSVEFEGTGRIREGHVQDDQSEVDNDGPTLRPVRSCVPRGAYHILLWKYSMVIQFYIFIIVNFLFESWILILRSFQRLACYKWNITHFYMVRRQKFNYRWRGFQIPASLP